MKYVPTSELALARAHHDRNGKAGLPLRQFIRAFCNHFRDQRQYRDLEHLPDYLLDDVGLTRADINRHRRGH